MPGTQRISKTEIRERFSALIRLFESLEMPEPQRQRLAADLCPERSGSNSQKALRYAYAAKYAAKSYSLKTDHAKELLRRVAGGPSGAM